MSKDKGLYKRLRRLGVRKRVAREAAANVGDGSTETVARDAANDLSIAADEIEARLDNGPAHDALAEPAATARKAAGAR